jgi:hypothetical protein
MSFLSKKYQPVAVVSLSSTPNESQERDVTREAYSALKRDYRRMEQKRNAAFAQRDALLKACKLALGQLEGAKPLSGVHASSLRADISIVREAIALAQKSPL